MTPERWLAKGARALDAASTALASGDVDTACNRAYYAMFNAARAALLATGQNQEVLAKTHSRLIGAFGEHLVKTGRLPAKHGRAIANASLLRLLSDYNGEDVGEAKAAIAIADAVTFLSDVQEWLGDPDSD